MKSLRSKLLLLILPVLFVALSLVAFINHSKAKEFLELEFADKSSISLEGARNSIHQFLLQKISEVEIIANTDVVQEMQPQKAVPYIARELERLEGFEMFGVIDLKGMATVHTGAEVDVSDRQYFIDTVATKQTVISEPIISRATGAMIVVVCTPIYKNGQFSGALLATVPIDAIQEIVREFSIGEEGFAFLVDAKGTVIAHPDEMLIMEANFLESDNQQLKGIVTKALANETGTSIYEYNQAENYAIFSMIPLTQWGLVISAPVREVTGNLSYLAKLSFVTAGVVLAFSILIVFIFARSLVMPIQKLSVLTSQVASGDLTVSAQSTAKDEVGLLSNNFDRMVKRIQELLGKIDRVSKTVKQSSDTLLQTSNETKIASDQVAITMNELASGTTDIADSVTSTTEKMATMLSTVNAISAYTNEVVETTSNSKKSATTGLQSANDALTKMNNVHQTVQETSKTIDRLDQKSKEIGNIIKIITNIADQTNLLALNASIEAARAGDHGKGFAVVAEEVRKLANETSISAEKISSLIQDTQTESQRAVSSIKIGEGVVVEGTTTVQKASQAFSEIASYIDEVLMKNKDIHNSVQQVQRFGSEISANMESISAVTEEASAGAEQVSATTEQQAAAANQISADAKSLAELAGELQEILATFKTNK